MLLIIRLAKRIKSLCTLHLLQLSNVFSLHGAGGLLLEEWKSPLSADTLGTNAGGNCFACLIDLVLDGTYMAAALSYFQLALPCYFCKT